MKYVVLPRADADLEDIWLYLALRNEKAADQMIRKIESVFENVAGFPHVGRARPELGRARPELESGIRSLAANPYIIFYRIRSGRVEIIRVLHSARDIEPLFH